MMNLMLDLDVDPAFKTLEALRLIDAHDYNGDQRVATVLFFGQPVLVVWSDGWEHEVLEYAEPKAQQGVVAFLEAIGHYGQDAVARFLEHEDLDEADDTDDGHAILGVVGTVANVVYERHATTLTTPKGF